MEEKEFDYMNVIPLVDVMLVLLTIVLTTSTFIATGVIPVELPKVSKAREDSIKTQTIEIDKKGTIYWQSRPVSIEELKRAISCLNKSRPVLIRADRDIALQTFVDVLDIVKNSGFEKVSLQTSKGL